ncbi:uridine kinase family protein [Microbacterium sp. 22296]|uniref:uridine kinase family protein n=1 Tax=Microbacterium sp. 22296 TaxID=3453903 RepID=UPI003F8609EC
MLVPDADTISTIAQVARESPVDGIRIVGVDGPSASGKSTLAGPVARVLDAPVIPVDDFISWGNFAGWWPRFDREVLVPLREGRDATYRRRDWSDWRGDSLGAWRTVEWSPFVVIEGVTCTRAAISDALACRVWVEASPLERLERGLERDGTEHRDLWERWMGEEQAFFATDGTASRADVRVWTGAPEG